MTLLPLIVSATTAYGAGGGTFGTAAWPSADRIIYVPLRIPEAFTVLRVFWVNGGTVNGNTNVGLYDPSGNKLWELGSTAQSGTNRTQFADVSPDQAHAAGLYYAALQHSNNTGQFGRATPAVYTLLRQGVMQEAAGSFALPASATFASITTGYLPVFGLDLRG